MAASILWYDLETFGRHPQWDRIAQFAAIRTNDRFEDIEEPVNIYCAAAPDYLPNPEACLVSKLTPRFVNAEGIRERDFAAKINALMMVPKTCITGYNSLRFDDEFIRALFYRNFFDPYKREYANGNTRWDIINLFRMAHDLRPEGIVWPRDSEGRSSFKLEALCAANGIELKEAHNALYDVRATIACAKLIHEKQRKLFKYFFSLRKKDEVRRNLSLQKKQPVVYTSGIFRTEKGSTSLVMPLSVHPHMPNVIIAYDLRRDPSGWIDESAENISERVFAKKDELDAELRIPLISIYINRSPAIAPLSTLSAEQAENLGIDIERCQKNADFLMKRNDLIQKIRAVYQSAEHKKYDDPELQIYSGDFFPDDDKTVFNFIRNSSPEELISAQPKLYDRRGPELLRRYIARNFPDKMPEPEREKWKSFCASRLLTPEPDGAVDFGSYMRDVRNRLSRVDTPAQDKKILKELLDYGEYLEKTVLS